MRRDDRTVSVIVPAYEAEQWLPHCLSALAAQTFERLEVVIVDDGSRDATAAIAAEFDDPRFRVVRQPHRGAAAARNAGLRATTGELVQFLDSDDLLSPDKIARQVEALESAGPGCIASCAWAPFSSDVSTASVQPQPVWLVHDPVEWIVTSLSGGGMMQPGAWLTPRVLIERAGPWNEELSLHDDGEFFTRVLLCARRNVFVPGVVAYYRQHAGTLSRRRSPAAAKSAFEVCRLRERALLASRDDLPARRALATQYAQFAYEFCRTEPALAASSVAAIRALRAKPKPTVGGRLFRLATMVLGLSHALRLRRAA